MYVAIRSWMSLIMDLIWTELSELFALEFAKIAESVFTLASTNVDQWVPNMVTIYDNEILDEFNYESNPTVTSGVICPWIKEKLFNLTLFTL